MISITPSRDNIATVLDGTDKGTLVYTKLVADLETPVSAMIKLGVTSLIPACWNQLKAAIHGDGFLSLRLTLTCSGHAMTVQHGACDA